MLLTRNNTHRTQSRQRAVFLRAMQMLLTFAAAGFLFPMPAFTQSSEAAEATKAGIIGTVAGANSDPIPNAKVVLEAANGKRMTATTTDDGSFALHDVATDTAYQIAISAEGFSDWNSSVSVEPGQQKSLGEIKLRVLASERTITVSYSSKEVAAQQLKAEENQRVLSFIPNIFVTYELHPEPLTPRMKFHLAYKGLTHPTFFAFQALWSGIQQAGDMTDYREGARGYGERFGANLAGGASEGLFANAALPALLHQDPRYFYRGSGTKRSRAWHALSAPFICEGDNGKLQPNYSQWGGSLIAASLSNIYYPDSGRGPGLVFTNFGTSMGLHVALGFAQEFLLPKFTSKGH
jgi:Carboxypeptidase regulatory-like domain